MLHNFNTTLLSVKVKPLKAHSRNHHTHRPIHQWRNITTRPPLPNGRGVSDLYLFKSIVLHC